MKEFICWNHMEYNILEENWQRFLINWGTGENNMGLTDCSAATFIAGIKEMLPEIVETYYQKEERKTISVETDFLTTLMLLEQYFKRIEKYSPKYRTIAELADILKEDVVKKKEEYMKPQSSDIPKNPFSIFANSNSTKFIYAYQILAYYSVSFAKKEEIGNASHLLSTLEEIKIECSRLKRIERTREHSENNDKKINSDFPLELKKHFDKYMIGQDELKKKLALHIYHHLNGESSPILLVGDTGSGKNYIIELLGDFYVIINNKIPIFIYDCTRLTPNGFSGNSIEDMIKQYIKFCKSNHLDTKKGIIYLDEFSKIVMPNHDSNGEDANALVMYQMMNVLTGMKFEDLDTSSILFILGGCFEDLNNLRNQTSKKVGFNSTNSTNSTSNLRNDLLKIGLKREVLGRIPSIIELEPVVEETIRAIFTHESETVNPIVKTKKQFSRNNLELLIGDDAIDALVKKCLDTKLGARTTTHILDDILKTTEFDMLEQNCSSLRLSKEDILSEKPLVVRKG